MRRNFDRIAAIAHAMRGALERADWKDVARLLREEWSNRRKNAPGISTPLIDRLVAATRARRSRGRESLRRGRWRMRHFSGGTRSEGRGFGGD